MALPCPVPSIHSFAFGPVNSLFYKSWVVVFFSYFRFVQDQNYEPAAACRTLGFIRVDIPRRNRRVVPECVHFYLAGLKMSFAMGPFLFTLNTVRKGQTQTQGRMAGSRSFCAHSTVKRRGVSLCWEGVHAHTWDPLAGWDNSIEKRVMLSLLLPCCFFPLHFAR